MPEFLLILKLPHRQRVNLPVKLLIDSARAVVRDQKDRKLFAMQIKLQPNELSYLLNEKFLSKDLRTLLQSAKLLNPSTVALEITNDQADVFRDAFGERMQEIGFNDKYEPTPEGKILDSLIDRFFVKD